MKCNRCQLHRQCNRNRRSRSRLTLEIFTLHQRALNRGCDGGVSLFIIVCYGYVSGKAICPFVCGKSRQSSGKHNVCCGFLLCSSYPSCWPPEVTWRV